MEKKILLASSRVSEAEVNQGVNQVSFELDSNECPYSIHVYPSQAFYDNHNTSQPLMITAAVAGIFLFTALMFLFYDRLVERRQKIILTKATNSNTILSTLFPKTIRDRLMEDVEREQGKGGELMAPSHRLKTFLAGDDKSKDQMGLQRAPIADLFPHT